MTAVDAHAVEVICDFRRCDADLVILTRIAADDLGPEHLADLGWSLTRHPRDGALHYCPDHTIPDTGHIEE